MLTILVFASVAFFPTVLLPSTPSMWVAGMTFGYGFGFLVIISAAAVGVSLPFIIGSIFHHKIEVYAFSSISHGFEFLYDGVWVTCTNLDMMFHELYRDG